MFKKLFQKKGSKKVAAIALTMCMALGNFGQVFAAEYVVQSGDYLVKIAEELGTTWRTLAELNKLSNPSLIFPGQVLQIPDGLTGGQVQQEPVEVPADREEAPQVSEPEEVLQENETQEVIQEEADNGIIHLTVLGTSDLHGNIWGFSYEDQEDTTNNGFSRVASYVEEVRAENPNTILLDNGDTIQGTILTDDLYNKKYLDEIHPMMKVMNELGYDSMALGNHEFNFGVELVDKINADADFPLLSGNTKYKDGSDFLPGTTVIEKAGLKIGVIGLVTPNIPRWDGEKVDSLDFLPLGSTASQYAQELIENENVDLIIATVHAGITAEFDEDGGSDAASSVAEDAPEIDVMLTGHYHVVLEDEINGVLIGSPRNAGRDVVRFDIYVDTTGETPVVTNKEVTVVDMANYEVDQHYRDITAVEHQRTLDFINGGGDGEDGEGGGVFGIATANFQPENEIKDIPEGKLRDTAVMDLINQVQLHYSGADVSAAALFKDTSDLKAGEITYGNIFDIYKFDNTLYVVEVTGKELKDYMEWSAACYNQWMPGDVSISFNPDKPGYLYDMFEGVDYKIDLSKPEGERIVEVMYKGAPLQDDQVLNLCVNNYRYSSALKAENIISGTRHWESPVSIRDYLVEYITQQGEIIPEVNNNWEITGVDLDSPYRDELIELVNNGTLDVPYDKSLNVNELLAAGVIQEK